MSSRVPAYQNAQKIGGFCNLLFKSLNIGRGLERVDVSFSSFLCAREKEIFLLLLQRSQILFMQMIVFAFKHDIHNPHYHNATNKIYPMCQPCIRAQINKP